MKRFAVAIKLLVVLLVLVGGGLFIGGRGATSDDAVVIRWWNNFSGPDGQYALRLVQAFNKENPDVRVLLQRMDAGTYYNKLFVAGLGKRGPEVFIAHAYALPRFERANLVRPINDLIERDGFPVNDIDPIALEGVMSGKTMLSLPLDIHPVGLYYNADLLKQAGVVDENGNAKPPKTREEFLDAVRRVNALGNGNMGYCFTWFRTNVFSVMKQFGGKMFNDDYTVCTLNEPNNVRALQYCADLILKEKLIPRPQGVDPYAGFRQGKVAMVFEGPWMKNDFDRAELSIYAAGVPVLGDVPHSVAGSHTLCMPPGMDKKREEAAWRFVKFLSDHSIIWADAGQIPARLSVQASPEFQKMKIQSAFAKQPGISQSFPRVPFVLEFMGEFDVAIERALRGDTTAQQALDDATARINQAIARDRALYDQAPADRSTP